MDFIVFVKNVETLRPKNLKTYWHFLVYNKEEFLWLKCIIARNAIEQ